MYSTTFTEQLLVLKYTIVQNLVSLLTDAPSHLHVTGRCAIAVVLAEFPAQPATLTACGRALTPVGPLLPGQRLGQVWVQDTGVSYRGAGGCNGLGRVGRVGIQRSFHGTGDPVICRVGRLCGSHLSRQFSCCCRNNNNIAVC